jgi:hypothetical protein
MIYEGDIGLGLTSSETGLAAFPKMNLPHLEHGSPLPNFSLSSFAARK